MRKCVTGALFTAVIALLLTAGYWIGRNYEPSNITVPESVLQDAQGAALAKWGTTKEQVWDLFKEEAANVRAQGFALEPVSVDISNPMDWLGRTTICTPDCGQRVISLRETYFKEDIARYVIVYELARALAVDIGLPQDTAADNTVDSDRSNQFAACFGSAGAKREAGKVLKAEPDCESLAKVFKRK